MLTAIRLKNCQSWEDITLNLSTNSLNVFVAENGVGKSVLFKMLKLTANPNAYSREERKDLIRFGEDCAQIVYAFDDGVVGCTFVYSNRVLYYLRQSSEASFEAFNEPPEELLFRLGLITNSSSKFVANILDTDQDLFLVESDNAGNIELLQKLADHPVLKEVIHKINDEIDLLTAQKHVVDIQLDTLEHTLKDYKYVDTMKLESDIERADYEIAILQELSLYKASLQNISDALIDHTDYNVLLQQFSLLQNLLIIESNLVFLQVDRTDYVKLLQQIDLLQQLLVLNQNLFTRLPEKIDYSAKVQYLDTVATLLELLEDLKQRADDLLCQNSYADELQQKVTLLRQQITASGLVIDCPMKGKVIYADEKCIPYS